jgi:drug/metabolite transporter (DMT)-like permease
VVLVALVTALAVAGVRPVVRGAVYGGAAGACFGTLAVMVDAASRRASRGGVEALFTTPRGIVPLVGIGLLGVTGMVLTMSSFQIGSLSATLPVNLATDPVTAVVFGAVLLREHIPADPIDLVGYALCLAAVIAGAVRLAAPAAGIRHDVGGRAATSPVG